MRALLAALGAIVAAVDTAPATIGAKVQPPPPAPLIRALRGQFKQLGPMSGAYVVDLTTGQTLFSAAPDVARIPASLEKLYTTATALLRFGPAATLVTAVLGIGTRSPGGTWDGTLYLRGGGDPTFGTASFASAAYGGGATVQQLVGALIAQSKIKAVNGEIVGDESYFDSLRGSAETDYKFDPYVLGELSALAFNRDLTPQANPILDPPRYAAKQLVQALRAAGVQVPQGITTRDAVTPAGAHMLATVSSPAIASLIALTNTPSDDYIAEMLLKGIGARFGGRGSTAAGAAVVRAELANRFGVHPRIEDGSGLSRDNASTPRQVVELLSQMATDGDFVASLALAGESGTLRYQMAHSAAQNTCRAKTGTLHDVSALAGYCEAKNGHALAFAFIANGLTDSGKGHELEDKMAIDLVKYG